MGHRLAETGEKLRKTLSIHQKAVKEMRKEEKSETKIKQKYEIVKNYFNYTGSQKSLSILSSHVKR